jgi:hypothetical protein
MAENKKDTPVPSDKGYIVRKSPNEPGVYDITITSGANRGKTHTIAAITSDYAYYNIDKNRNKKES